MSHSQKISSFTVQPTLDNSDLITIVRNGQNFVVPFSTFKIDLGVTGSISQTGSPTGTPVLETVAPNVFNVRNSESGPGVLAELSPENGVKYSWNINQDQTGVPITSDLTKLKPNLSSFVPGAGMQITKVGDVITFTATGTALPATKAVTVNVEADFPTAVGGVITLEADTVYIISNNITTSNRFARQNNTSVVGYSELGPTLTYTGTGTMFTSADSNTLLATLSINCANGKVVDWTDTTGNTKTDTFKDVRVLSCVDIGSYTAGLACVIDNFAAFSVAGVGFDFFGTGWSLISFDRAAAITANTSFVGIDLGAITSDSIELDDLLFQGPSGAIGVTGLSDGGNVTVGNLATITNSNFGGAITPITIIDPVSDVRWESLGNDGIGDSRSDSLISIQGNADVTTIITQSVPVIMAGTWTDENSSRFVLTPSGGRMTYIGERDAKLPIDFSVSILTSSGGDKQVSAFVAINGVAITNSMITTTASSSQSGTVKLLWQHTFQENDFIEVFLANESDTVDLIGQSAIGRID